VKNSLKRTCDVATVICNRNALFPGGTSAMLPTRPLFSTSSFAASLTLPYTSALYTTSLVGFVATPEICMQRALYVAVPGTPPARGSSQSSAVSVSGSTVTLTVFASDADGEERTSAAAASAAAARRDDAIVGRVVSRRQLCVSSSAPAAVIAASGLPLLVVVARAARRARPARAGGAETRALATVGMPTRDGEWPRSRPARGRYPTINHSIASSASP